MRRMNSDSIYEGNSNFNSPRTSEYKALLDPKSRSFDDPERVNAMRRMFSDEAYESGTESGDEASAMTRFFMGRNVWLRRRLPPLQLLLVQDGVQIVFECVAVVSFIAYIWFNVLLGETVFPQYDKNELDADGSVDGYWKDERKGGPLSQYAMLDEHDNMNYISGLVPRSPNRGKWASKYRVWIMVLFTIEILACLTFFAEWLARCVDRNIHKIYLENPEFDINSRRDWVDMAKAGMLYRLNVGVFRYVTSIVGVIDLLSWLPTGAGLIYYAFASSSEGENDQNQMIIDTPFSIVYATV